MDNSTVISVQNVTKLFGKVTGVKEISFTVEKGEIFGFLGPNGSGKTTAIRLLLDLLKPVSGTITLFGLNHKYNSMEIRERCGYLPGNFSAYSNLTGIEFFKLMAGLRKRPHNISHDLARRLSLEEADMKRRIRYFSHGMLQKIGIIQACMHSPELLILDEPTIGLDPLIQNEFYEIMKEYRAKGGTIFLSSHNLAEVEKICHRVAIIRKGQIIKEETIASLRRNMSRKLILTLKSKVDDLRIPGARMVGKHGLTLEFDYTGTAEDLLKQLAVLPVADIVFPEPDLQEIFINYYKGINESKQGIL